MQASHLQPRQQLRRLFDRESCSGRFSRRLVERTRWLLPSLSLSLSQAAWRHWRTLRRRGCQAGNHERNGVKSAGRLAQWPRGQQPTVTDLPLVLHDDFKITRQCKVLQAII